MQIQAKYRLQQSQLDAITYRDYCNVVSSLCPNHVVAFEFPSILSGFKKQLEKIVDALKQVKIGYESIIAAFKEKSVFKLFKGLGFSLVKILKAIKEAAAVFSKQMLHAIEELHKMGAFKHVEKSAKVIDEFLDKYPILKKLTGPVVAGLLFIIYLKSAFMGDLHSDLGIVDSLIACLKGSYSIYELFATPAGLHGLVLLCIGLLTGGSGLVAYGFGSVESALKFFGSHAGDAYNLLLALFYAGAKRLHLKLDYHLAPKAIHSRIMS